MSNPDYDPQRSARPSTRPTASASSSQQNFPINTSAHLRPSPSASREGSFSQQPQASTHSPNRQVRPTIAKSGSTPASGEGPFSKTYHYDAGASAAATPITRAPAAPQVDATPLPRESTLPQRSSQGQLPPQATRRSALPTGPGTGEADVDMTKFLKDITFAMQGIDNGEFFNWDEAQKGFVLHRGSFQQRGLFGQFAPIASIRRTLKHKLLRHSPSCLQQGLKHALQAQLEQYDAFVSSLSAGKSLTLQALHIARLKSEDRLTMMLKFLQESERAKGGELVTKLQPLLHSGNSDLYTFAHEVYREAVQPLLALTVKWLTTGEVSDPDQEFFIAEQRVEPSHERYWTEKFKLRVEMIPVTFTHRQAEHILAVGKNIHLLRDVFALRQWRMNAEIVAQASTATFDTINPIIEAAMQSTNADVMQTLREQHKAPLWFARCRCIYLLSDDHLYRTLIRYIDPSLSTPISGAKPQAKQRELQDAMQRTLSEQTTILDPSLLEVTNYIQATFDPNSVTRSLWDAFGVQLVIARPMQHIFTTEITAQYKSLFSFLFRVMRAEVTRVVSWRGYVMMDRALENRIHSKASVRSATAADSARAMKEVCLQTTNLFKQVDSFITNLRSYLVNEVLEVAWSKFCVALDNCKSFDEVLGAHKQYLAGLSRYCLLDPTHRSASEPVQKLVELSMEFFRAQSSFALMLEKGSVGDTSTTLAQYQRIFDVFNANVAKLLTVLRTEELKYDFLQPLGARLNFTHFYHADPSSVVTDF